MSKPYYVSTDPEGIEHSPAGKFQWPLPHDDRPGDPAEALTQGPIVLHQVRALLDVLDASIYRAEPLGHLAESDAERLEVSSARLIEKTLWNDEIAARFALDCAEHVLGDAGDVALPNGMTLAEVLADARTVLSSASDEPEHRLGILACVDALRRLRREGEVVGDIALALLVDDDEHSREAIEDPAWTTVAATADALLAAVEALRHLVLPRYVKAREDLIDAYGENSPLTSPQIFTTPWGPAALGGEFHSPYVPAFAAARDAAARARDVAREARGEQGESDERAWQAERLEQVL